MANEGCQRGTCSWQEPAPVLLGRLTQGGPLSTPRARQEAAGLRGAGCAARSAGFFTVLNALAPDAGEQAKDKRSRTRRHAQQISEHRRTTVLVRQI